MNNISLSLQADEVLRKVGRNVVGFQQIEWMLKALSQTGSYAGSPDEIRQQHQKHLKTLRKKSFGQVVSLFFDVVYNDGEQARPDPDPDSFSIRLQIRGGEREELKAMLEALVDERNELIHTRLAGFDRASVGGCTELEAFLDAQHERMEKVRTTVTSLLEQMRSARPLIAEALTEELKSSSDRQDA